MGLYQKVFVQTFNHSIFVLSFEEYTLTKLTLNCSVPMIKNELNNFIIAPNNFTHFEKFYAYLIEP